MESGSGALLVDAKDVSYWVGSGKLDYTQRKRSSIVDSERGTYAGVDSSRAMLRVERPGEACIITLNGASKSLALKLDENYATTKG